MPKSISLQIEELKKAIEAQENLRSIVGNEVTNAALQVLHDKLASLEGQSPSRPSEQRKMITVMFADVAGFTTLSEKLDVEDIMSMMNQLWTKLDATIIEHGGHIDKHMGDNVIALWGVKDSRENDAEQAIRAALSMQETIAKFEAPAPLELHIALHSGQVVLGEVGSQREYTAMGNTMNLAAHLERLTPAGTICITHDTYRLVRGLFDVEAMPLKHVSGISGPVQTYHITSVRPNAFRLQTRGVEGIETRMIGRDRELDMLNQAFQNVVIQKKTRAITIIGDAGLGKSRLMHEFERWHETQTKNIWLMKGRATERTMLLPFALLRDMFAFRLNILDSDTQAEARNKLISGIVENWNDPQSEEMAHFIGHMLGLDYSESPYLRGILEDPRQIHDQAKHYLVRFFAAISQEQPVIFLLEDLHWADDDSLAIIELILQQNAGYPMLIVNLARPNLDNRKPDWCKGMLFHTRLDLHPLNTEDSHTLVQEILQRVETLPPVLEELIVQGAEGNPFYIEELIKMLIDEHAISTGNIWQVDESRLGKVHVPTTLTGIIQSRIDSLSHNEKLTLQCASIIGRVFWKDAIFAVSGLEEAVIRECLESLQNRELIFIRSSSAFASTREYIFKHAILREVTYNSVLRRDRRKYHAQVANWLAEHSGKRTEEFAAAVAEHYELAENFAYAARWYGQAGKQAYETYAPESAVTYLQKALELARAGGLPEIQIISWHENLGKSLFARARLEDALQTFHTMRNAAEKCNDIRGISTALHQISFTQDFLGDTRESLESARQAHQYAEQAGNEPVLLLRALNDEGWANYHLGNADEAIALGEQSLQLAQSLGKTTEGLRQQAQAYQLLGAAYELRGQFDKSTACEDQSLELFRVLGDRRGVAAMLNNQGVGAFTRGDFETAVSRYEEALQIVHQIGSRDREIMFLSNLGGAKVGLGQFSEAEQDLRLTLANLDNAEAQFTPLTHAFLSEALLGLGKLDDAFDSAREAVRTSEETEQKDVIATTYRTLGNCSSQMMISRPDSVIETDHHYPPTCYRYSLELASEIGSEPDRARALRDWGRHELNNGNPKDGEEHWRQAHEIFEALNLVHELLRMDAEHPLVK